MLAFVATLAYAVGLLAVNTYLLRLGASDFDLFRPRYVLTGLLGISIVAVIWLFTFAAYYLLRNWTIGSGVPVGYRLLGLANGFLLVAIPFLVVRDVLRLPTEEAVSVYFFSGVLGWLIFSLVWHLRDTAEQYEDRMKRIADKRAARLKRKRARRNLIHAEAQVRSNTMSLAGALGAKKRRRDPWQRPYPPRAVVTALLLVFLVPYASVVLMLFAEDVLPSIPEQWGGTEPRYVRLLVDDSVKNDAETLGLPMSEGAMTDQLVLLYEGSVYLVLTTRSGDRLIRLNAANVLAMRVDVELGR